MVYESSDPKSCLRCGSCCAKGGPALHMEDLDLVRRGVLPLDTLFTLRPGETARDQPAGALVRLGHEVVKIRGAGGSAPCVLYDPEARGCAIYASRPLECRVLLCSDPEPLKRIYAKDRLGRAHILGPEHPLMELARALDHDCPADRCLDLAKALASGHKDALDDLARLVRFDAEMRRLCADRAGLSPMELDFVLGRPLPLLLEQEGVRAEVPETGAVRFSILPGRRT